MAIHVFLFQAFNSRHEASAMLRPERLPWTSKAKPEEGHTLDAPPLVSGRNVSASRCTT